MVIKILNAGTKDTDVNKITLIVSLKEFLLSLEFHNKFGQNAIKASNVGSNSLMNSLVKHRGIN